MLTTVTAILYLAGAFVLMLFMYLIARFYRIKLDPGTPVFGFLVAMIALIMAITGIIIGDHTSGRPNISRIFVDSTLFISGIAGAWNSITLYIRMKRVHK